MFVDNILFGLTPFAIATNYIPFFGCSCVYSNALFQKTYGYPLTFLRAQGLALRLEDYLSFRDTSIYRLIKNLSYSAHKHNKVFGINLYDPYWHTPEIFFKVFIGKYKTALGLLSY